MERVNAKALIPFPLSFTHMHTHTGSALKLAPAPQFFPFCTHTHTRTKRLSLKVRTPACGCSHRRTSCSASPLSFFIVCLWCPMCASWLSFNPSQHTHTCLHACMTPRLPLRLRLFVWHKHTLMASLRLSVFYCVNLERNGECGGVSSTY